MYISETQKIRPLMVSYCRGDVVDIGCGPDLICSWAAGVDIRKFPNVSFVTDDLANLSSIISDRFDFVFSSHCLEHFKDDLGALKDWIRLAKDGGHIGLYLPDGSMYDNSKNPEHLHDYRFNDFVVWIEDKFPEVEIVESGTHFGDDLYSFYVVMKKK